MSTRTTKNSKNIATQASETMHISMQTTHRFNSILIRCSKFDVATTFCVFPYRFYKIANNIQFQKHTSKERIFASTNRIQFSIKHIQEISELM